MVSFQTVIKIKKIGSAVLLLMYLASTLWISAFHSHAYIGEHHADDIIITLSFDEDDQQEHEIDSADKVCIYCQFLTQQHQPEATQIAAYPITDLIPVYGLHSHLPQNDQTNISDRAPPVA
jgi:hypothetical protein